MALVKHKGFSKEIEDGQNIADMCEDHLEVLFGCKEGICGTCEVEVLSGMENLNELTEVEKMFGIEPGNRRLTCQCIINQGEVELLGD